MKVIRPDWFEAKHEVWGDFGDTLAHYHTYHPRVNFLKTLRRNAKVLDVGAGDGSITVFREWIQPVRKDLKFHAYALEKGNGFDSYAGFEIGRWPDTKPDFQGMAFDAIYCSHFIEHIGDPLEFVSWCVGRLNEGGRLYLEWPSEASLAQPKNNEFQERGIPLIISNFHDDDTHQLSIPKRADIVAVLESAALQIDQQGLITNPFFEQEVLANFSSGKMDDRVAITMAYWSASRWAQNVIATKTGL